MPIKDPDNINWAVVVYLFSISMLGSLASYFYNLLKGSKFQLWSLAAQVFISIFSGALVIFIASYLSWAFEFAGGIAGLAGWSGATFIKALEDRLIKNTRDKND